MNKKLTAIGMVSAGAIALAGCGSTASPVVPEEVTPTPTQTSEDATVNESDVDEAVLTVETVWAARTAKEKTKAAEDMLKAGWDVIYATYRRGSDYSAKADEARTDRLIDLSEEWQATQKAKAKASGQIEE